MTPLVNSTVKQSINQKTKEIMKHDIDVQDLVVYGLFGLSLVVMGVFKSGDIIADFQDQSVISGNAKATVQDNAISIRRFDEGCNTGFLIDGESIISPDAVALDIDTRRQLRPGAVLCDQTGATAILDKDGIASDIRLSATVRRRFREQKFRDDNKKTLQVLN